MRPNIFKKDDPKAIPNNHATGIQPSHLALLEATCSKIGDTFQESCHPVFTQKSFTNYNEKKAVEDNDSIRSCVFNSITLSNSQPINCFNERSPFIAALELQHNQPISSSQQTNLQHQQQPSCMKIKTETNNNTLDYNQNYTEGMHVCPNIITETRLLESQARASFNRSCCHDNQTPSCTHQTNTPEPANLPVMNTSPQCQHESTSSLSHVPSSPSSNSSSCLFQPSPGGSSQSSSCAMTTLTHLPISSSNNNNNNSMLYENARQKSTPSINPWQNQSVHRQSQDSIQKSSCMLHENYGSTPTTPGIPSSPQERGFRTYSPHEQHDRQFSSSFRSPEYGPTSVESHHPSSHYVGSQPIHSPHQQTTFDSYSSPTFDNNMDVKPDPYILHQQSLRSGHTPMIPGNYDHHQQGISNLPNTPDSMALPPPSHHYLSHSHPPPGISYGNPNYPGNFPMHQNPDLVPGNPMGGPSDMVPPNYVDYQYQQQMFYSRENRRPRRIACTCPNCRDGENKTVTTKDGKQRKLHICHIPGCGKEYGKTSHLRAHLRWHAGERPFACNWLFCNKRFTRSDELQRHRRTHTGDKRFECPTCLKKFMRSDHLSKHMKTHQSQNKQNKEKGTDNQSNMTDKNKTVSKNTQQ